MRGFKMSIVVISVQAGGKGDLIFGCKLAKFLESIFGEKIYLINAISATTTTLSEFDKFILTSSNSIELIHFIFNEEGGQDENTISTVQSINWNEVTQIFIGPSHNYNYGKELTVLPDVKFEFLRDNLNIIKNKPIYLMTEYSFKCHVETCKDRLEESGFNDVNIHYTGLGDNEIGIFLNDMPPSDNENQEIFFNGMKTELSKEIYTTEPTNEEDSFYQKGLNLNEIKKNLCRFDCFSIYYNSNDDSGDHFERFIKLQNIWVENKKYKNPLVLVVGPAAGFYLSNLHTDSSSSNRKAEQPSKFIFLKNLDFPSMQAFYRIAQKSPGIGGCTGDQSLSDTLSAGLIPIYHATKVKQGLSNNLAAQALKKLKEKNIKNYLEKFLFDYNDPYEHSDEEADNGEIFKVIDNEVRSNLDALRKKKDLKKNLLSQLPTATSVVSSDIENSLKVIREGAYGYFSTNRKILAAADKVEAYYNRLGNLQINPKNTVVSKGALRFNNTIFIGSVAIGITIFAFAILKPEKFSEVVSRFIFSLSRLFAVDKTESVSKNFEKTM